MNQKRDLSSIYRRIKKNCCVEWSADAHKFYEWYDAQLERQIQNCHYCRLPGDTGIHYGKRFREGKRGKNLEVDKKDNAKPYSPGNCVLACYPCNNAKSDVFSYEEFLKIGDAIHQVVSQKNFRNKSQKSTCTGEPGNIPVRGIRSR
jgi:5-methylcytosine-specific restriction endonuclease McrA